MAADPDAALKSKVKSEEKAEENDNLSQKLLISRLVNKYYKGYNEVESKSDAMHGHKVKSLRAYTRNNVHWRDIKAQQNSLKQEISGLKSKVEAKGISMQKSIDGLNNKISDLSNFTQDEFAKLNDTGKQQVEAKLLALNLAIPKLSQPIINIINGDTNDKIKGSFDIVASIAPLFGPIGAGIGAAFSIGSMIFSVIDGAGGKESPYEMLYKALTAYIDKAVKELESFMVELNIQDKVNSLNELKLKIKDLTLTMDELVKNGTIASFNNLYEDIYAFTAMFNDELLHVRAYVIKTFPEELYLANKVSITDKANPLKTFVSLIQNYLLVLQSIRILLCKFACNVELMYPSNNIGLNNIKFDDFKDRMNDITRYMKEIYDQNGLGVALSSNTGLPYNIAMYSLVRIYEMMIAGESGIKLNGESDNKYGIIETTMNYLKEYPAWSSWPITFPVSLQVYRVTQLFGHPYRVDYEYLGPIMAMILESSTMFFGLVPADEQHRDQATPMTLERESDYIATYKITQQLDMLGEKSESGIIFVPVGRATDGRYLITWRNEAGLKYSGVKGIDETATRVFMFKGGLAPRDLLNNNNNTAYVWKLIPVCIWDKEQRSLL